MLGAILGIIFSGLIVGMLARFAVPGPDPLPIWKTILLGVLGSIIGGVVARLLGVDPEDSLTGGEALTGFLCSLGGAVVLLILYRRFRQGRSVTGPDSRA